MWFAILPQSAFQEFRCTLYMYTTIISRINDTIFVFFYLYIFHCICLLSMDSYHDLAVMEILKHDTSFSRMSHSECWLPVFFELRRGRGAVGDVSIYLWLQPRKRETWKGREREREQTPLFTCPLCSARRESRHSNHSPCSLPLAGENLVSPICQSCRSREIKTSKLVVCAVLEIFLRTLSAHLSFFYPQSF